MKCDSKVAKLIPLHHHFDFFQRRRRHFAVTVEKEEHIPGAVFCSGIHLTGSPFPCMQHRIGRINQIYRAVRASTVYKNDFAFSVQRPQRLLEFQYSTFFIIGWHNDRYLHRDRSPISIF